MVPPARWPTCERLQPGKHFFIPFCALLCYQPVSSSGATSSSLQPSALRESSQQQVAYQSPTQQQVSQLASDIAADLSDLAFSGNQPNLYVPASSGSTLSSSPAPAVSESRARNNRSTSTIAQAITSSAYTTIRHLLSNFNFLGDSTNLWVSAFRYAAIVALNKLINKYAVRR